jgi:CTP synthase
MATRYIFVTGGVVSGLGKGITAAAIGCLLKARGLSVRNQKFDPYINVDPSLMNPTQHGEIFITEDGAETDLDIGHYERFTDVNSSVESDITSGMIYLSVINRERSGGYRGGTVQVVPHIINEIKSHVYALAEEHEPDVIIAEIGGTVGDMEGQPYIEAIRQLSYEVGRGNCLFIHVTLLPVLGSSKEVKTKPTQHSVQKLLSYGVQPDVLVCRSEGDIDEETRHKLGLFCNVPKERIIANPDCDSVYELPLLFEKSGLAAEICRHFGVAENVKPDLDAWEWLVRRLGEEREVLKIALVGKYVVLHDAYYSVIEALDHAGIHGGILPVIEWISSEDLEGEACGDAITRLLACDGILVPGGFGKRGTEGMVTASRLAREQKIPFFGIGLGMQMAVVDIARHEAGLPGAGSDECGDVEDDVIYYPGEKACVDDRNYAKLQMRRGAYHVKIEPDTPFAAIYNVDMTTERYHNRRELNPAYQTQLITAGMGIGGTCPDGNRIEAVYWRDHPFFVGTLYLPQLISRPIRPHPLFNAFLQRAAEMRSGR